MNPERRILFKLDTLVGSVAAFLFLSIALVFFIGNQAGVRVTAQLPQEGLVGPFETFTFVFSEPVDESLAIQRVLIEPEIRGKFQWDDSKTLRFTPTQPLEPATEYTLTLSPGALAKNDRPLKKIFSWKFEVRPPLVAYLMTNGQQSRLWTIEPRSRTTNPLTDGSLRVVDFDTSRDGEFVVFSAFNEQKGIDLWRTNRTGDNTILLLPCDHDHCTAPAISPDGRRVAYVRESATLTSDIAYEPRIWILDLENKLDVPLYEDRQILGIRPAWSPNGAWLASFDGLAREIRLLDVAAGEQLIIPSQTGDPVAWSADGSNFLYTDLNAGEFGVHTRVQQVKLSAKEITTLFGDDDERNYYYNALAWSPTNNRLVIGVQPNEEDPSGVLWLVDLVNSSEQAIVNQPEHIYNAPRWDPWGSALIFQQSKLYGVNETGIVLWMSETGERQALSEGSMPRWLP